MARPLPTYANVAPAPPGRTGKVSSCVSCKCSNCHDVESCSGSVVNGGYLRTVPDRPPIPCRQRKFTDDFSPEESFSDWTTDCDKPKHDTKRMKELDIPLPLPSGQINDSVFDNCPSSIEPPSFLRGPQTQIKSQNRSIHDPFIQRHPSSQPSLHSQTILKSPFHRKPSDALPVPNEVVSTQPLIQENKVELPPLKQKEKEKDQFSHQDVTLPRKKNEVRKNSRRRHKKAHMWMKVGTIISLILFIGLSYMVVKTVRDIFFVHHRHSRPSQHIWNYSEPDESKLDTTVCFSCELVDEFRNRHSRQQKDGYEIYGFKSSDNKRHCCMDQLGHAKWIVNMMKTTEILGQEATKNTSNAMCSAKSTHVPIRNECSNNGEASLKLDNTNTASTCQGARINVTQDSLVTKEEGLYIVYMTMTVTVPPDKKCGEESGNKVIKAHLHCDKSAKKKCIEMEAFDTTKIGTDSTYHAFNFYTMKKFARGERFYPLLSHPSYLYSVKLGNYIGVVQL